MLKVVSIWHIENLTKRDIKMRVALLDVDGTLICSGNGSQKLNQKLIQALNDAGIKDVFLFTEMTFKFHIVLERLQLIRVLKNSGFTVHGVITHNDLAWHISEKTLQEVCEKSSSINFQNEDKKGLEKFKSNISENPDKILEILNGEIISKPGYAFKEAESVFEKVMSAEYHITISKFLDQNNHIYFSDQLMVRLPIDDNGSPLYEKNVENQAMRIKSNGLKLVLELIKLNTAKTTKALMLSHFLKNRPKWISSVVIFDDREAEIQGIKNYIKEYDKKNLIEMSAIKVTENQDTLIYYARGIQQHEERRLSRKFADKYKSNDYIPQNNRVKNYEETIANIKSLQTITTPKEYKRYVRSNKWLYLNSMMILETLKRDLMKIYDLRFESPMTQVSSAHNNKQLKKCPQLIQDIWNKILADNNLTTKTLNAIELLAQQDKPSFFSLFKDSKLSKYFKDLRTWYCARRDVKEIVSKIYGIDNIDLENKAITKIIAHFDKAESGQISWNTASNLIYKAIIAELNKATYKNSKDHNATLKFLNKLTTEFDLNKANRQGLTNYTSTNRQNLWNSNYFINIAQFKKLDNSSDQQQYKY